MQVEVIYNHGQLTFASPVTLKHDYLRLSVDIPDDEISPADNSYKLSSDVIDRANAMLTRMEAIRNAPFTPDDELPELTEKQLNNIEAFDLRDEIKEMR